MISACCSAPQQAPGPFPSGSRSGAFLRLYGPTVCAGALPVSRRPRRRLRRLRHVGPRPLPLRSRVLSSPAACAAPEPLRAPSRPVVDLEHLDEVLARLRPFTRLSSLTNTCARVLSRKQLSDIEEAFTRAAPAHRETRTMTDRSYLRISLDSGRSGSITKQREQIARVASADLVEYVDESVSGGVPFAERPAGARLLADLERGDRVLFTRIDRAARNVADLLALVERLQDLGVDVVFTEQNIDTAGPMGEFILILLAAVAQLERAIVSERATETRASFRRSGRFGGGPIPFGFRLAPHPGGRGQILVPDEDTRDAAREAVARVLAGEPQRDVRRLAGLTESGFTRWLRNPILIGSRTGDPGDHDPDAAILSLAEWRRLQDHLATREGKTWSKAEGYGAALVCAECGDRLYLRRDKRYADAASYVCARRRHEKGSPSGSITRRTADDLMEREFLAAYGHLEVLEEVITENDAIRDEAIARAEIALQSARQAQDVAESREERRSAGEAVLDALDALDEALALPTETVTEIRPTGRTFAEEWRGADDDTRAALLRRVGPWQVHPGHRWTPIEQKITRAPRDVDEIQADYLAGQLDD